MTSPLRHVFDRLFHTFGPQDWWPGESPFEVIVGAILVQNTAWRNVEKAIANLRRSQLLSPAAIDLLPQNELEQLIRPVGYYRLKARRLRNLIDWLIQCYDGSLGEMFAVEPAVLRQQLLCVKGVGPETADSILLYAGNLPVFVADTYTYRILARHGWVGVDADYHVLQQYCYDHLEPDAAFYNEFHALLVRVGHLYCRKTPKCQECPLCALLPEDGPVELP